MAISLRCPIVFMMLVSAFVGVKVNLSISYKTRQEIKQGRTYDFIILYISLGQKGSKFNLNKSYDYHGTSCLNINDMLRIKMVLPHKNISLSGFNVAFDSNTFKPKKTFDEEVDINEDKKMCLLWGSWIPKIEPYDDKTQNADIYFNFLTKKTNTDNRYLFLAKTIYSYDNLYFIFHLLPYFLSKQTKKMQYDTHMFSLVTKQFSGSEKEKAILIKGSNFPHKSSGTLFIPILAERSEEEAIEAAFEQHNSDCSENMEGAGELGEANLIGEWEGLTFSDTEIVFNPKIALNGQGVNQLVI